MPRKGPTRGEERLQGLFVREAEGIDGDNIRTLPEGCLKNHPASIGFHKEEQEGAVSRWWSNLPVPWVQNEEDLKEYSVLLRSY